MAPNGHEPEEMNRQPQPFRKVMEEALGIMDAGMGQPGFCGNGTEVIDIPQLAENLSNSTDIPEKARPFIEKLTEVANKLNGFEQFIGFVEEFPNMKILEDKINELDSSLAELVEVSTINNSLKKLSKTIRDQINMLLIMIKNDVLDQSQEKENLIAGLDELFDEDK